MAVSSVSVACLPRGAIVRTTDMQQILRIAISFTKAPSAGRVPVFSYAPLRVIPAHLERDSNRKGAFKIGALK